MPVTKFRPRPVADLKYQTALVRMGVLHGSEFDCQREGCSRCKPFRTIERKVYNSLSDEEKHEVRFNRYGI